MSFSLCHSSHADPVPPILSRVQIPDDESIIYCDTVWPSPPKLLVNKYAGNTADDGILLIDETNKYTPVLVILLASLLKVDAIDVLSRSYTLHTSCATCVSTILGTFAFNHGTATSFTLLATVSGILSTTDCIVFIRLLTCVINKFCCSVTLFSNSSIVELIDCVNWAYRVFIDSSYSFWLSVTCFSKFVISVVTCCLKSLIICVTWLINSWIFWLVSLSNVLTSLVTCWPNLLYSSIKSFIICSNLLIFSTYDNDSSNTHGKTLCVQNLKFGNLLKSFIMTIHSLPNP